MPDRTNKSIHYIPWLELYDTGPLAEDVKKLYKEYLRHLPFSWLLLWVCFDISPPVGYCWVTVNIFPTSSFQIQGEMSERGTYFWAELCLQDPGLPQALKHGMGCWSQHYSLLGCGIRKSALLLIPWPGSEQTSLVSHCTGTSAWCPLRTWKGNQE